MIQYDRTKSQVSLRPSAVAIEQTAPDASRFGASFGILFRWKGSIYRLVWRHLLVYHILYYAITILYKNLDEDKQKVFEAVARHYSKTITGINVIIMLGFFTTTAMQRLFTMQTLMPGTAKLITIFAMSIKPKIPEGPIIIEQFARWTVLSWVLTFRIVSKPMRHLFPDMISLQRAGILKERERMLLERVETESDTTPRPLVVIDWILLLTKESYTYNRLSDKSSFAKTVESILAFKKSCGNTIKFATQNMPHALIQATIIIVYAFGLVTLVARGIEEKDKNFFTSGIASYFPLIPSLQFIIFLTWLSFGRAAVNPFGTDETDIDLKTLFEKHVQDSLRLARLYSQELGDFFNNLPQKPYNDAADAAIQEPQS